MVYSRAAPAGPPQRAVAAPEGREHPAADRPGGRGLPPAGRRRRGLERPGAFLRGGRQPDAPHPGQRRPPPPYQEARRRQPALARPAGRRAASRSPTSGAARRSSSSTRRSPGWPLSTPRKAKVIELRCFAGLSIADTALAVDLSHATVERDLKVAQGVAAQRARPAPPGLAGWQAEWNARRWQRLERPLRGSRVAAAGAARGLPRRHLRGRARSRPAGRARSHAGRRRRRRSLGRLGRAVALRPTGSTPWADDDDTGAREVEAPPPLGPWRILRRGRPRRHGHRLRGRARRPRVRAPGGGQDHPPRHGQRRHRAPAAPRAADPRQPRPSQHRPPARRRHHRRRPASTW